MITVEPTSFTKVEFVEQEILAVAEEVRSTINATAPGVDLGAQTTSLVVREDEATARMEITSLDPIVFTLDSGALEDTRVPRHLGVEMASVSLASLYIEYLDRTNDSFGAPGLGEPTDLADKVAWSVYTHSRVQRAGYRCLLYTSPSPRD